MCKRVEDQIGMLSSLGNSQESIAPAELHTSNYLEYGPQVGHSAFSTLSVKSGPSDYFNSSDVITIKLKVGNDHKFILREPNFGDMATLMSPQLLSPK